MGRKLKLKKVELRFENYMYLAVRSGGIKSRVPIDQLRVVGCAVDEMRNGH